MRRSFVVHASSGVLVKSIILSLALVLGLLSQAMAETRYVSDRLEIQMRAGKGTQFRILRSLPSGTPLEVLEVDKQNQYSRVRAPGGVEGWVLNHLLMSGPSARDRLAKAEKKLARLELENSKLKTSLAKLREDKGSTDQERSTLKKETNKLNQELERIRRTASSALAIDAENKDLKNKIVGYERQSQSLLQENQSLKDRTARDWFMVGAGVILLGMIIGLIIPRIRWRKKSSWDSL
ncbi:MAG TPA: TIGR04211 family SH3 domain-containing protein [Gammaproteobacteria bacterium]|nr:TIGR04211 family SH3 domain-containing protein [Gammaproteobacteria bacterium]